MLRSDNKLSQSKRRAEEIDMRLKEAGIYDEGYSLETKTKLLAMVEESVESARQQEEEQQYLNRIMAESLNESSSQKESSGQTSTSTSNRYRKEKSCESSSPPEQDTQEESEPRPSTSSKADRKCESSPRSANNNTRGHPPNNDEQDDDLFILSHRSAKTKTKALSGTSKVIVRREFNEGVKSIKNAKTSTPNRAPSISKAVAPLVNERKVTTTTTTTNNSTPLPSENGETRALSPSPTSPQKFHQKTTNSNGPSLSPKKTKICTPTKDSPSNSQRCNDSEDSSIIENSPSPLVQNYIRVSPRPSLTPFKGSPTKAVISPSPSQESDVSNSQKQAATSPVKKNLNTSFTQDSSPSRIRQSPNSGTSKVNSITAVSSATTTITLTSVTTTSTTTTTPTTPTRPATLPSNKEDASPVTAPKISREIGDCVVKLPRLSRVNMLSSRRDKASPQRENKSPLTESPDEDFYDASAAPPETETKVKVTRFRGIDVFSSRSDKTPPLKRKKPLISRPHDKAFYCGSNESEEQCRIKILDLMNAMALCLCQHQSSLPPMKWPRPVIVDRRVHNSLDKPKPASRFRQKVQRMEVDFEMEDFQPRVTRRTRYFQEATEQPVAGPSSGEGTSRVRRTGSGRTLGVRRNRNANKTPSPVVNSDSDTDLEITLPSISFYPKSQDGIEETEHPAANTKNKPVSQPPQRRKTFDLESTSESSDNESSVNVKKVTPHAEGRGLSRQRNDKAASSNSSSELCLFDDDKSPYPLLTVPPSIRGSPRGIRRPGAELPDVTPNKLRKTQTLSQDSPTLSSVPEVTSKLPSDSPVYESTPNEDMNYQQKYDNDATPRLEETEEIEEDEEEKIPCPICQVLYSMKKIQEHASDCLESESPQHIQPQTRGSRRPRTNDEAAVAIVSASEPNDR